jgi:hypothetical protein
MSTARHRHQLSHFGILEQFDLLFGVCDRVDSIVSSLAKGGASQCCNKKRAMKTAGMNRAAQSLKNATVCPSSREGRTYVKPHDRALDIPQSSMQPVSLSQVYGGHPRPAAPVVASVVGLDCLLPELAPLLGAVLAKADIDQEVAVVEAGFKVVGRFIGSPLVDGPRARCHAVPAPKLPSSLRLRVHRRSERDDTFDLGPC